MREKNSERPDMRDNRSKNSIKTGKKKKKYKKPGICGYHVFVSGIVYLPDGVFFLLSIF